MPPASIASRVRSTRSRSSPRASRSSSAEAGGNFGAPPKPPLVAVGAARGASRPPASRPLASGRRAGPGSSCADRAEAARASPAPARGSPRACRCEGVDDRFHHHAEARHPAALVGREVGAAVEGHALGVEEDGHRPAALAGHRLHRLHVDRVDVGPLLAVDLDADEVLVHVGRGLRVLEGLALHHVAPVAGRVADREQDRLVLAPRAARAPPPPRIPVDRVVAVLEQVGTGLLGEPVGHRSRQLPGPRQANYSASRARRCSSPEAIAAGKPGRRASDRLPSYLGR